VEPSAASSVTPSTLQPVSTATQLTLNRVLHAQNAQQVLQGAINASLPRNVSAVTLDTTSISITDANYANNSSTAAENACSTVGS
jgi:hypothetical protein